MSAQAAVIRHAIAQGLQAIPNLQLDVHEARHRSVAQSEFASGPVVLVFTDSDHVVESRPLGNGVRRYVRELEVHVAVLTNTEGRNDAGANIADRLDHFGEEIERWFFAREAHDPIWVEAIFKRSETGPAEEGNSPTAAKVLIFAVTYHDQAPKPDSTAATPLQSVDVDYDVAPSDGQVDATDNITIPQL